MRSRALILSIFTAVGVSLLIACSSSKAAKGKPGVPPPSAAPQPQPAPAEQPRAAPAPAAPEHPAPAPQPAPAPPPPEPVTPAVAPAPAPPPLPPSPPPPYMDIIRLKQAGFSEDFLLAKIRNETIRYQLDTDALVRLRSAGISETVINAMMQAGGQSAPAPPAPVAEPLPAVLLHAEFSGLVHFHRGFLGFGRSSVKGVGKLVVDGDKVNWYEGEDPDHNFSVYAKNIKEVYLTCVLRPQENLCLEIGIVTFTGEEWRFREPGWKLGENKQILSAYDYFKKAFPKVFFTERAVAEL